MLANRNKKKENFFEILNKLLIPNIQEQDDIINYEEKCTLKFFKFGSEILFFHHDSFFSGNEQLLNEERKKVIFFKMLFSISFSLDKQFLPICCNRAHSTSDQI